MKKIVYSVFTDKGGDIFSGYKSKFISSHLNKSVADRIAKINSGWVEEELELLHPDYIHSLERQDEIHLNTI